mmetsp:Transcript_44538/g.106228  ORF Transcript_44538/g.106228 Transcript_44538/m.106228 type:complete len:225 (+) Transcript_44538:544-1218(+)
MRRPVEMGTPRAPGGAMSITYGRDTISSSKPRLFAVSDVSDAAPRRFGDARGDTAVRMLTRPHLPLSGPRGRDAESIRNTYVPAGTCMASERRTRGGGSASATFCPLVSVLLGGCENDGRAVPSLVEPPSVRPMRCRERETVRGSYATVAWISLVTFTSMVVSALRAHALPACPGTTFLSSCAPPGHPSRAGGQVSIGSAPSNCEKPNPCSLMGSSESGTAGPV